MSAKFDFSGRKILVTGAGRGIGRDVAEKLYESGATVYALSRTKSYLDDLKTKCPNIHIIAVDLENWEETRKAVEAIVPIDAVVNNAGFSGITMLLDATPEDYDKLWKTNLISVLNVSQVVAKGMIETGKGGSIVNISSDLAKVGIPGAGMYASTKAALDRLTKSMALEWGPHGIRANSLNISLTATDMTAEVRKNENIMQGFVSRIPLGRILQVEDVTSLALFMLSDLSTMISGENIILDGGRRCT